MGSFYYPTLVFLDSTCIWIESVFLVLTEHVVLLERTLGLLNGYLAQWQGKDYNTREKQLSWTNGSLGTFSIFLSLLIHFALLLIIA